PVRQVEQILAPHRKDPFVRTHPERAVRVLQNLERNVVEEAVAPREDTEFPVSQKADAVPAGPEPEISVAVFVDRQGSERLVPPFGRKGRPLAVLEPGKVGAERADPERPLSIDKQAVDLRASRPVRLFDMNGPAFLDPHETFVLRPNPEAAPRVLDDR